MVVMHHTDKNGGAEILNVYSFPLTGVKCVSKIITDLAVFEVDPEMRLRLVEVDADTSIEDI